MSIRITHIRLSDSSRTHQAITDYKWVNPATGKTDSSSKATLVAWLDGKKGEVYVGTGSQQTPVGVVHPASGLPYLRTYADQTWTNNLLELPTF